MKATAFLVAPRGDEWVVGRARGEEVELRQVPLDAVEDADASLAPVRAALDDWGYAAEGVCLALPTELAFSARIDCDRLPRSHRRAAMLYRLEEQLPLDAERLTADFLPPAGGRALGVAVETAAAAELVDRLAAVGIEVASICPASLLALWDSGRHAPGPAEYAIVADDRGADVFRMNGRGPVAWLSATAAAADAEALSRCIEADMLDHPAAAEPATARLIAPPDWPLAETLGNGLGLQAAAWQQEPPLAAATRAAGAALAGRSAGWIDLRRDALAPKNPWGRLGGLARAAVVLAVLLPAVLAAAFTYRASRYEAAARAAEGRQVAAYRRAIPNTPAPANVKSRLESELKRRAGLRGAGSAVPDRPCALDSLRQVVAHLPPAVRLRITELRISESGIVIDGQTRTHSDAEKIQQTLADGGFVMEPPRTESLAAGGVSFTLAGATGSDNAPGQGGSP